MLTDRGLERPGRTSSRLLVGSLGLVAYTFVGYPALMGLFARLRPRPCRSDPSFRPRVTLIVAAYNEEDVIVSKLENVLALAYPRDRLELIVAADGSVDGTVAAARAVDGTIVLHDPERRGKLAALARAAAAATGDVLVFSDANNMFSEHALRDLVAPFADPAVGVVTGRKAIDDGTGRALDRAEGLYWRYESKLKEWESAVGSVSAVAGEILAFRREAFQVPNRSLLTEDFVQAMLAALQGWRVVYAPRAVSVERASATVGDEAVRRSRIVRGRWQALAMLLPKLILRRPALALQVISHKGLRPLVPGMLLAAATSNVLVARKQTWPRWIAAGQVLFYAAAVAGWRDERRGRRKFWLFVPYYFCRMNVAAASGLVDAVRCRDEAFWKKVRRG